MIRDMHPRTGRERKAGAMAGFHGRRLIMAAMMAFGMVLGVGGASAQAPKGLDAPAAVSTETKATRSKLDSFKLDLDQKELALQGRELSDPDLQRLRQGIDPVAESIRHLIDDLGPKLDASKARLEQLGPKPKEGQPDESADVSKDRAEREGAVAELDETQRLGRALLVQAEQLSTQIVDRRRAAFTRALFEQSSGILSPTLWFDVAQALPRVIKSQTTVLADAVEFLRRQATPGALLLVGLALG